MTASWKPDPEFKVRFGRRRDLYISGLTGAVATMPTVVCRPVDRAFTFGWAFEQPTSEHPHQSAGGIDFAANYLRHMIDQGFHVAYAVSLAEGGTVHLQAWELPDVQKPWPDDLELVFTAVWCPMSVSRRPAETR